MSRTEKEWGAGSEEWKGEFLGGPPSGQGHQDWAQVYSTVHVSPVWLGGWGRGPVGVTTEAGVCGEPGTGPSGERRVRESLAGQTELQEVHPSAPS